MSEKIGQLKMQVAGKARKDLEKRSGKKVVTKENYLGLNETKEIKRLEE